MSGAGVLIFLIVAAGLDQWARARFWRELELERGAVDQEVSRWAGK